MYFVIFIPLITAEFFLQKFMRLQQPLEIILKELFIYFIKTQSPKWRHYLVERLDVIDDQMFVQTMDDNNECLRHQDA